VAVGQDALIWLASRPDLLEGFLASSGLAPGELRARAAEPAFLGFVLDWILAADATVLDFAAAAGLAPEEPARARAALGGAAPNWT
jgi:hypothetical protein